MRTIGIIAEYNPFHSGHAWQIKTARAITGADYCVVIMSPDFVQRGFPAIADKYTRTRMALLGGADLVLELPVRFSLSSAQGFARGAVGILDALGCVDTLVFGCEAPNPQLLDAVSRVLAEEPEAYRMYLKKALPSGCGFAAARERALISFFDANGHPAVAKALQEGIFRMPNNILGLEYLTALRWTGSSMQHLALQRQGDAYHEQTLSRDPERFCSASAIRACLEQDGPDLLPGQAIPEVCRPFLSHTVRESGIPRPERFSALLHYRLLMEEEAASAACSSELFSRIRRRLPHFTDASSFAESLCARQFPRSSVDRALARILLGLSLEDCTPADPTLPDACVRILGFRRKAAPLLHQVSVSSRIPVITKPASAGKLLNQKQLAYFSQDLNASRVYQLLLSPRETGIPEELTFSPIMM